MAYTYAPNYIACNMLGCYPNSMMEDVTVHSFIGRKGIPIVGDAKPEGRESFYVHLATREERGNLAQSAQRIEVFVVDDD